MFCKIGMINYMYKDKIKQVIELNNSFGIKIIQSDEMQDNREFPENISNLVDGFMIKRVGYRYESEVRLICYSNENERESIKRYCICPNDVIDQILIHPRVNDHELCGLKCTLRRIGFTGDIKRSELNDMD